MNYRLNSLIVFALSALVFSSACSGKQASAIITSSPSPTLTPSSSPVVTEKPPSSPSTDISRAIDQQNLTDWINNRVNRLQGTYGVFVHELMSGRSFGINSQETFFAGSVIKLTAMAALYHQAASGEIDLEEVITPGPDDIQDWGTGVIQDDPPGTSYSLRTLAELMMKHSDNTAFYLLVNRLGSETIQNLIEELGLHDTHLDYNTTTPEDMALLLTRIFFGDEASKDYVGETLEIMTHTEFEDRIPALLPSEIPVAHKIGQDDGICNDAGIVFLPSRPYVIVIFSLDADWDEAIAASQEISRKVFDFEKEHA